MPPIHLLNELRHLVPSEFESKLLRSKIYDSDVRWTDKAKKNGLLFDLSRVEWVEFGTLVQLILLVESALIGEVSVTVALPIPEQRHSEQEWVESEISEGAAEAVAYQITRRRKVVRFLDYLGFTSALRADHLDAFKENLTILSNYDSSRPFTNEKSPAGSVTTAALTLDSEPTKLYEFFFPLTWLSKGDDAKTVKISKFLAGIVGQRERGLEAIDAEAISNVILYELIDNVKTHAGGSGHALVAAWARREGWVHDTHQYIDCEQPFIEWLSQRQSSSVEIVVGDSGKGVPRALEGAFEASSAGSFTTRKSKATKILHWAFDRWSTSRDDDELRGTRGLYRVDRVVSKYQGLITLRAENALAGRDHGGASYDEPISAAQMLSTIPGTIMRCRMPSFHEDSSPRITAGRIPRKIDFDLFSLGAIGTDGIEKDRAQELKERLAKAQLDKPVCVVAVVEGASPPKAAVEPTLRQCVETRHPGMLVLLGLPGGWALIEGAIDSINAEHKNEARGTEAAKRKHFEVWDPVLVIGPQGQFGWVGANEPERLLLEHLLASSDGAISSETVRGLIPQTEVRASSLKYFRGDTNLIRFQDDGRILELLVTGAELIKFTRDRVDSYLSASGRAEGILSGTVFRTPSLLLVNRWLDVRKIVERTCGDELLMFALSQELKQSDAWAEFGPANTILADSTVSATHLGRLREYLGTDVKQQTIPGETGAPALPGSRVLSDGARVVVYCDVIAASEAVGRCLRQIRREGAEAVAVVCVIDAREIRGKSLVLHGMKVPIISLTTLDMVVSEETAATVINVNPITRTVEEPIDRSLTYEISRGALDELIQENNALHFSHIGRPIGRHFTFYLNALPFFDSSLIRQSFGSVIDSALKEWNELGEVLSDSRLEVWHPSPEPEPSEPARRFTEMIRNERRDVALVKTTRRESAYGQWVFTGAQDNFVSHPTVVVIDWGALTGTTVMQAIRLAAQAGARRVLVCVFLSQLKIGEEAFLRSLRTLRVNSMAPNTQFDAVKSLPFDGTEPKEITTKVIVRFLAGYPVEAYSRYECPVCQQLDRLSQEEYPTDLLRDFASYQKETRLRLRTREQVLERDPQDFDDKPIPTESILWMLDFRGKLVEALVSTASRKNISDEIDSHFQGISASLIPKTEVLWLLLFLSIESQWLRRPPLYFRRLRDTVSQIALQVALNSKISESERLNAVIVLRTSNKSLFAESFASLFRSANTSEQLMRQLLYDAFTYLTRPYHQTPLVFRPIRDGLREVKTLIGDRPILLTGSPRGEIGQTVDLLLMRAETELAKAGVRLDTPVQAWSKLRNDFSPENYDKHDSIPQAISWMVPALDAEIIERQILEAEQDPLKPHHVDTAIVPWLKTLKITWETCSTFLDYNVLPRLARLKPVLVSKEGRDALGNDTIERLIPLIDELSEFRAPISESEFSRLVNRISENPDAILSPEIWAKYKSHVAWYGQRILRPKKDPEPVLGVEPWKASRLIKFLLSAPTSIWSAVREVYEGLKPELPANQTVIGIPPIEDTHDHKVFCTERLVYDVVKELLRNVGAHVENGDLPVNIWISVRSTTDTVTLTVDNDNSVRKHPPGRGLNRLDSRLQAFGGSVKPNPRPTKVGLSYSVDVLFLKGE